MSLLSNVRAFLRDLNSTVVTTEEARRGIDVTLNKYLNSTVVTTEVAVPQQIHAYFLNLNSTVVTTEGF